MLILIPNEKMKSASLALAVLFYLGKVFQAAKVAIITRNNTAWKATHIHRI